MRTRVSYDQRLNMPTDAFAVFLSFLLSSPVLGEQALHSYVVSEDDGKTLDLKQGKPRESQHFPPVYAEARMSGNYLETGWSFFQVKTGVMTDPLTARAVGKLEGSMTTDLISMAWQNTLANYCSDEPDFCSKLDKFVGENLRWMLQRIQQNPKDAYWYQVNLFLEQLKGLKEGYNEKKNSSHSDIPDYGFLLMQIDGDLSDLETVLGRKAPRRKPPGTGSCSALVKVLPSNKDLFITHVTWNTYDSMLRIFKFYDFTFSPNGDRSKVIPGAKQCFSSYPGQLLSGDDYYMLSSGLVSQETTIDNYNKALWKFVQPEGIVLEGIRNVVANRLATTATEWASIFSKYNSGTYNNQWMILDYNLFTPGEDLKPGTFVVLEQLPGNMKSADMTGHLKKYGYWASYNLPYFPSIYNKSQQPDDPWFDYHKNPRAQIFARDQGNVDSMSSLLKLMRYNDYKNDPLSRCNCTPPYSAENAISARSDLNPADGKYPLSMLGHRKHGGTDVKATNYPMFKDSLSCVAVSGPTNDQQPAFQWSTSGWPRPQGHPDKWDFEVQKIQLDF